MAEFIQNLFSTPLKEGIAKSSNAMRRKVFHLPSSSSSQKLMWLLRVNLVAARESENDKEQGGRLVA